MTRIFESLYKYFSGHKGIMWALLTVLSVLSIYFGSKVEYEEDITKLLPASATADSGLAFGNLKVKDKIFIQISIRCRKSADSQGHGVFRTPRGHPPCI